jgi:hypothetical protein
MPVTAVILLCPGCLFVRHTTRVVRKDEVRQPVRFESEQAQYLFEGGISDVKPLQGMRNPEIVAVPLLLLYARTDVLSDAAFYNDQLLACDTDGNRSITLDEALAYRARTQAKVRAVESTGGSEEPSHVATAPADKLPPGELVPLR